MYNGNIRNIAIIAHVDHGKTTLVDQMFKQCGMFHSHQELAERVMDNTDLERERGITISAKNCSINWKGIKVNILDTPGHADFGGEVERALLMVDGVLLLVDAAEGPLPQTRFVLQKALANNLKVICVINKIDRQDARPAEVLDEVYDLFIDLGADDDQIDFPVYYAIGREGKVQATLEGPSQNLHPLLDAILDAIPPPGYDPATPFQMLVSDLGYSDFTGKLAIGRIACGQVSKNDNLLRINRQNETTVLRAIQLQEYEGLGMKEADTVQAGDILVLAGLEDIEIGDTICTESYPHPLPRIRIDPPTVSMRFMANTSPFAGQEGRYVQSTKLGERLHRESLRNVAIEFEETQEFDGFIIKGRGEFQMAILIEMMRREGYEFMVGRPEVILHRKNGEVLEPIEELTIDCEDTYIGIISQKLSQRKGNMKHLHHHGTNRVRLVFHIPARGIIGYRSEFLTDTRGTGLMSGHHIAYEPHKGEVITRVNGSMVSDRSGAAVAYALFNLEARGKLSITPGQKVYHGMIIGEHNRESDLVVNPCREKKLTNVRAAGSDEAVTLTPTVPWTIERAIEFIREDEIVEITPKNIRPRKIIPPKK